MRRQPVLFARIVNPLLRLFGVFVLGAVFATVGCSSSTGKYEEPEGGYKQIEPAGKSGSLPKGLKLKSAAGGQKFGGKSNSADNKTKKTEPQEK